MDANVGVLLFSTIHPPPILSTQKNRPWGGLIANTTHGRSVAISDTWYRLKMSAYPEWICDRSVSIGNELLFPSYYPVIRFPSRARATNRQVLHHHYNILPDNHTTIFNWFSFHISNGIGNSVHTVVVPIDRLV